MRPALFQNDSRRGLRASLQKKFDDRFAISLHFTALRVHYPFFIIDKFNEKKIQKIKKKPSSRRQ